MVRVNLAILLAKKKWNVMDLHRATGIRYMTLNDLYNEFAISIKLEHIEKICEAGGWELTDLIEIVKKKK